MISRLTNFFKKIYKNIIKDNSILTIDPKLNSKTFFHFYLKSLNNSYSIPVDVYSSFNETFSTINKLSFYSKIDYYSNLTGPFSNYLVPNFDYLFTVGLYFSLLAIKFQPQYIDKIIELMDKNKDVLKDDVVNILKNSVLPFDKKKVFEFLGSNFISRSTSSIDSTLLPDQKKLVSLFMRSRILLFIANEKNYVDVFLKSKIQDFLKDFSDQFSNFPLLTSFIGNFINEDINDIVFVKKVLNILSDFLGVLNEFIKPYVINSNQEVSKILNLLIYLNVAQKDSKKFDFVYNNLDSDYKNLANELILMSSSFFISREKSVVELSKNLYINYLGILSTFLKKSIRNGDLSYGDGFYFLKIYSLSSMLIDYISNGKFGSLETQNLMKIFKENLTKFGKELSSSINDISILEVINRISSKVIPSVIQKSPDMPKDRTFWLRLYLWVKSYNSLKKEDPNYYTYRKFMINKLNSIIKSYPDTSNFSSFLNNFLNNDSLFDSFFKNIEPMIKVLASSPVAMSYNNPDYLFSQLVRLVFLKNNKYNSNVHSEFIQKLLSNDKFLQDLFFDLNDYQSNLRNYFDVINNNFYEVLDGFYRSSTFLLS